MIHYTFINQGSPITCIYKGNWSTDEVHSKKIQFRTETSPNMVLLYQLNDESIKGKKKKEEVLFKARRDLWSYSLVKMISNEGTFQFKKKKRMDWFLSKTKYQFIDHLDGNKKYHWYCHQRNLMEESWKLKDEHGSLIASIHNSFRLHHRRGVLTISSEPSSSYLLYLIILSYKSISLCVNDVKKPNLYPSPVKTNKQYGRKGRGVYVSTFAFSSSGCGGGGGGGCGGGGGGC